MADELSQSQFDETIQKFQKEVMDSGEETRDQMTVLSHEQLVGIDRSIGRLQKAMLDGLTATAAATTQQLTSHQEEVAEEDDKSSRKQLWLLTNLQTTLGALVTLSLGKDLSDTERQREEKRASEAFLGALGDIKGVLGTIKGGIFDALKLAANPLGLLGAILGVAIGTVAGLSSVLVKMFEVLKLNKLFAPLIELFSPKSQLGIRLAEFVKDFMKRVMSIFRVIGETLKKLPPIAKILKFMKPFIVFGRFLGKFILFPVDVAIGVIKGILGILDEIKKGGDIIDVVLRGIGDFLDWITFGLIDADQLKELIGEPIRTFISGIKELFTEGFSLETLRKIFEPLGRLVTAMPTMVIRAVGRITAWIAEKLGFENFAGKLREFLADFNLFDFIQELVEGVGAWFSGVLNKLAELPDLVGRIKDSLLTGIASIFTNLVTKATDIAQDVGQSIVDMFNKIVDTVFGFVIDTLPDFLLPEELEQEKKRRQQVQDIRKEMGDASIEEAKAELERRRQLAALEKKAEGIVGAIVTARQRGETEDVVMLRESLKELNDQIQGIKAAAPVQLQRGGIVSEATLASVAESHPEAVIPLSRLDDLVVNPSIAAALQLANQMALNTQLRDQRMGGKPLTIAPVTATQVQAPQPPAPIIAPLSMRNNENTMRRLMDRDFRGAHP